MREPRTHQNPPGGGGSAVRALVQAILLLPWLAGSATVVTAASRHDPPAVYLGYAEIEGVRTESSRCLAGARSESLPRWGIFQRI